MRAGRGLAPTCLLVCLSGVSGAPGVAQEMIAPTDPLPIGSRLQLFVDDGLIERLDGTRLVLHRPVPREVVFVFDAPWEGPWSGYVTIMQDGERYRMYYRGGGELTREHTCLAGSADGIRWTRPSLGLFEFEGSKENNIVWTGAQPAYCEAHNFTPFKDSNPDAPADQRYKAVALTIGQVDGERRPVLVAFISPDGIRWRRLQEAPILTEGGFDSQNVAFWDTLQRCYVCYSRAAREGRRSVQRSTSSDFVHWTRPEWLDLGDRPLEHFYTNGIVPYFRAPHIYLGFPQRFVPERTEVGADRRRVDGLSDAVLISSRDGLHWQRTFMEAFLRPGADPANWGGAHGNTCPAWGILQTGAGELSLYWADHYGNWPDGLTSVPRLWRGTLRLDGFVSVQAPYEGGQMLTRPLCFEGRRLLINYATSAVGYVRVELQDADGQPLPGFTLDEADEIYGDEVERVVGWRGGTDVSRLAERPVRVRFVMKDADLYSMRFAP